MDTDDSGLSMGQQMIIQAVRSWIGASLLVREQELREFVARGVDDPRYDLNSHVSDCGLFALAIWHAVGVPHELVNAKYVNGMAITWIVHIAHDLQSIRYPKRDGLPVPGALMHYFSPRPSNNDHLEFYLKRLDEHGLAWHAGGGRAECEIGDATSNILWSSSRPLQCWYDPRALLELA